MHPKLRSEHFRKNKSMDIFESLRQAYKDSSKAFPLTVLSFLGLSWGFCFLAYDS